MFGVGNDEAGGGGDESKALNLEPLPFGFGEEDREEVGEDDRAGEEERKFSMAEALPERAGWVPSRNAASCAVEAMLAGEGGELIEGVRVPPPVKVAVARRDAM